MVKERLGQDQDPMLYSAGVLLRGTSWTVSRAPSSCRVGLAPIRRALDSRATAARNARLFPAGTLGTAQGFSCRMGSLRHYWRERKRWPSGMGEKDAVPQPRTGSWSAP